MHKRTFARLHRSLRIALAIAVVSVGAEIVTVEPASATATCNTSGHCYSTQSIRHGQWIGLWGAWHRNNDNPGAGPSPRLPGAHINSQVWFQMNNQNYIETGLRNGYEPNGEPGSCNCIAYSIFWADHTGVANHNDVEYRHFIANVSPTGQDDSYQIVRAPNVNQWQVYLNGNLAGVSTVLGDWTAYREDMGGELQNTSAGYSFADEFQMWTRLLNTSNNLQAWDYRDNVTITGCAGFEGISNIQAPGYTEWTWRQHAPAC